MNLIERKIDDVISLCKVHKVSKLFAFGSVLEDTFNNESDIDLIVDFKQVPIDEYADNYFNLKFELESIFNRSVDLLEEQAIKNPHFKREIDKVKRLIYG